MGRIPYFLVLALAVTAGGVFAFATYNYVQKVRAERRGSDADAPVVVAATDLDIGAEIGREDIKVIDWPANAVPAARSPTPRKSSAAASSLPVIQNEPILPMKLAVKEAGAGLPPAIPPGLRAVSVRVNEVIGVAGYVLPARTSTSSPP